MDPEMYEIRPCDISKIQFSEKVVDPRNSEDGDEWGRFVDSDSFMTRPKSLLAKVTEMKVENDGLFVAHEDPYCGDSPHLFVAAVRSEKGDRVVAHIHFQEGSPEEVGVNGVCNENILQIVAKRLCSEQESGCKCEENADAIAHLLSAIECLEKKNGRNKAV